MALDMRSKLGNVTSHHPRHTRNHPSHPRRNVISGKAGTGIQTPSSHYSEHLIRNAAPDTRTLRPRVPLP